MLGYLAAAGSTVAVLSLTGLLMGVELRPVVVAINAAVIVIGVLATLHYSVEKVRKQKEKSDGG